MPRTLPRRFQGEHPRALPVRGMHDVVVTSSLTTRFGVRRCGAGVLCLVATAVLARELLDRGGLAEDGSWPSAPQPAVHGPGREPHPPGFTFPRWPFNPRTSSVLVSAHLTVAPCHPSRPWPRGSRSPAGHPLGPGTRLPRVCDQHPHLHAPGRIRGYNPAVRDDPGSSRTRSGVSQLALRAVACRFPSVVVLAGVRYVGIDADRGPLRTRRSKSPASFIGLVARVDEVRPVQNRGAGGQASQRAPPSRRSRDPGRSASPPLKRLGHHGGDRTALVGDGPVLEQVELGSRWGRGSRGALSEVIRRARSAGQGTDTSTEGSSPWR